MAGLQQRAPLPDLPSPWPSKPSPFAQTNESAVSNTNALPFTPELWDQNAVSSINWMPTGLTPNFASSPGFGTDFMNPGTGMITDFQSPMSFPHAGTTLPRPPTTSVAADNHGVSRHWLDTVIGGEAEGEPATPSSTSQATGSSAGRFYVDGDGARLPKIKPQKRFMSRKSINYQSPTIIPGTDKRRYGFPPLQHPVDGLGQASFGKPQLLGQDTYVNIYEFFRATCAVPSPFYIAFETANFPPREVLNAFVHLYLDNFQTLLPFLHPPTLDLSRSHWLLALAIAAVGSRFAEIDDAEAVTLSLHEYLRRAIQAVVEATEGVQDPVLLSQVKVLSCMGMAYSGDIALENHVSRWRNTFVSFCAEEWIRKEIGFEMSGGDDRESVARDWQRWKEAESRRRTGYAIWLLDCMWAYQFGWRPLLAWKDARVPLPCQEVLWEATSAMQWRQAYEYYTPSQSLVDTTQAIYVEKKVQTSMGEFSRILLIHALYQRSWEVENYLQQPLSRWTPTAERQEVHRLIPQTPVWLPEIPLFSRWRNAACDCLDVLHWSANSMIGANSGMEHPTVCHLHLARVILLTPLRHICDLAYGMTKEDTYLSSLSLIAENRTIVRRWAMEDQHKARLAMIHAGVLFWHVRRYSASAFYEPSAVMLAALALWAYGTFTEKLTLSGPELEAAAEEELSYPTSINLDRPADDELVQTFIRRGDRMQAMVTGVGDICTPQGPERVLNEGAKLISALANWGATRKAMRVLGNLAQLSRQRGEVDVALSQRAT